jgi:CrcB protein
VAVSLPTAPSAVPVVPAATLRAACSVVALGAVAGSTLRWAASESIGTRPGAFPAATLLVNLIGCLLVGIAATRIRRGSLIWLALVTGGLGGLTTYSAFAVETRALIDDGHGWTAAAYVVASLTGGLGAAALARRGRP